MTIEPAANPISLMRSVSTPCDFASSSPKASIRRSPAIMISAIIATITNASSNSTSLQLAPKSVPIIHRNAAVRSLAGERANAMRMIAEKSALRTSPDSSSRVGSVYSRRRARMNTAAVAAQAPMNATIETTPGMRASPSAVVTAAPHAAPPDTPRMNGSASGLRSKV